jgi:hypothetical protein
VFGVRFAGPMLMVSLAGAVSLPAALDAALHDPALYRELLELALPSILAFDGMFLLMVFLRYFFDEAKTLHWFLPLERASAPPAASRPSRSPWPCACCSPSISPCRVRSGLM